MYILIINGSPRSNGNTFKISQRVKNNLTQIDSNIKYEYIHLNQINLQTCRGCYQCLDNGQDKCPIKDDQKSIEKKMQKADGVIFTSPVYVANVSGLFKNFLDRFAYICHRPMFHGKKAMVICSTGAVASGIVSTIMKISVEVWGFEVVSKIGANISPNISQEDKQKQWDEVDIKAKKASMKFYNSIVSKKLPRAKLVKMYSFILQKSSFKYADPNKADYKYWKSKGWLEKDCKFYLKTRINPIAYYIAYFLAKLQLRKYPKGNSST